MLENDLYRRADAEAKITEFNRLQRRINERTSQDREDYDELVPLLAMRREVLSTSLIQELNFRK